MRKAISCARRHSLDGSLNRNSHMRLTSLLLLLLDHTRSDVSEQHRTAQHTSEAQHTSKHSH